MTVMGPSNTGRYRYNLFDVTYINYSLFRRSIEESKQKVGEKAFENICMNFNLTVNFVALTIILFVLCFIAVFKFTPKWHFFWKKNLWKLLHEVPEKLIRQVPTHC